MGRRIGTIHGGVMKCIHIGNICNVAYSFTKALRLRGFEADLMASRRCRDIDNPQTICNKLPAWVKWWDKRNPLSTISWAAKLNKYNFLHVYTGWVKWARFYPKPYIATSLGSDLREMAFRDAGLRKGFEKARAVLFANPDQIDTVKKLDLQKAEFIPAPVESNKFRIRQKKGGNFTIFSASRHDWKIKGNDVLIKGFSDFLKEHTAKLYLVDWGEDANRSKELIKKENMSDNVEFLPVFSPNDLANFCASFDVYADQFIVGSFGTTALEMMACGKPVLLSFNEDSFKECYGDIPPLLNAKNPREVADKFSYLAENRGRREKIGQKTFTWAKKHHDELAVADQLILIYNKLF